MSIGQALPRMEDGRFLSGRSCFVDDLQFPEMLHAVVVRSQQANAVLKHIDCDAVKGMPGVRAVFTFSDIAKYHALIPIRLGPLPGFERYLQPPMACERVRYVGEPVALVVADNRYLAEDAAEALPVEYEALPPVLNAEEGMKDASLVHPEVGTNVGTRYTSQLGNAAEAFSKAKFAKKARFRCHRHSAIPMETRGLVVVPEGEKLALWGATKSTSRIAVPWRRCSASRSTASRCLRSMSAVPSACGASSIPKISSFRSPPASSSAR